MIGNNSKSCPPKFTNNTVKIHESLWEKPQTTLKVLWVYYFLIGFVSGYSGLYVMARNDGRTLRILPIVILLTFISGMVSTLMILLIKWTRTWAR